MSLHWPCLKVHHELESQIDGQKIRLVDRYDIAVIRHLRWRITASLHSANVQFEPIRYKAACTPVAQGRVYALQ